MISSKAMKWVLITSQKPIIFLLIFHFIKSQSWSSLLNYLQDVWIYKIHDLSHKFSRLYLKRLELPLASFIPCFMRAFLEEKIIKSWSLIGFIRFKKFSKKWGRLVFLNFLALNNLFWEFACSQRSCVRVRQATNLCFTKCLRLKHGRRP